VSETTRWKMVHFTMMLIPMIVKITVQRRRMIWTTGGIGYGNSPLDLQDGA
jgi:hypothetical protein